MPEFNSGAMENAGCVTHNEDYVFRSRVPEVSYERRAVTILHEMAHMWFGDLVTMTWWDDLWLNESFAEWASTLAAAEATRWTSAWTTFANTDKTWAYRQDQLPSTHPIAAEIRDLEDVEVNFDGITYAKGASVLKLLAAWVGREEFLAGIRAYFRTHAWGNTTLADLLGKLEETSGRDLKAWSAEWLETAGVNTLRARLQHRRRRPVHVVRRRADRAGGMADAALAPPRRRPLRSHRRGPGPRATGSSSTSPGHAPRWPSSSASRSPTCCWSTTTTSPTPRSDSTSGRCATLTESIGGLRGHAGPLAVLVGRLGHDPRRRDGRPDYLTLVLGGVGTETDSSVIRTCCGRPRPPSSSTPHPTRRDEARLRLADGLLALLREAAPGSDTQLQFLRAFAAAAYRRAPRRRAPPARRHRPARRA